MALTSYVSGQIIQSVPTKGNMKVDRFTADGTWTVPAGVTYAIAHIRAGGGGAGRTGQGTGGTSSVAFASGTVSATGGAPLTQANLLNTTTSAAGAANSGNGATAYYTQLDQAAGFAAQDGAYIVAGGDVTPAASINVTVGAGGVAGTSGAAGGSGYVWIEYLV
jgi:hypothetical protein